MSDYVSLKDFIDRQISGDWGKDKSDEKYNTEVFCIRGADINAVNEGDYNNLPIRYIESKSKTKFLNKGSIIIEISGGSSTQSTGRVCFVRGVNENIICSNFCRAYEVKREHSPKYFYYLVKNIYNSNIFFNFESKTTGIKNLLIESAFENIKVPQIDFNDQKSIAKVLSDLDAKIELNNKINRELEAVAKLLYDYWFVQFDFPNEQGKPYKSSGGKMVYNSELKREIPEGWTNGTLGNIAELIRGVTYDASEIKNENDCDVIPILRATNISGNVIDLNNMVFVPKQNVSSIQVLNRYDILITMSSGSKEHIGKNGFFYFDKKVSFGAFCAKIVAKDEYRFYLYCYTQSDFMFSTIKNECLGTNINNLNGSLVKAFKMVIPPNIIIKSFNEKVSSVYEKIGNNLMQNQQLSELRDWLLPMLMNGQVTVKENQ